MNRFTPLTCVSLLSLGLLGIAQPPANQQGLTSRMQPAGSSLQDRSSHERLSRIILTDGPVAVTSLGAGGEPSVTVHFRKGKSHSFLAAAAEFRGGIHVALGDVNGDGVADVIVGMGAKGAPVVKVYNGSSLLTGQVKVLVEILVWPDTFQGGVEVAAADVNGDGLADIICGAGPGGGPEIKVYDGLTVAREGKARMIADFFAWELGTFAGGVHVAGADINGDGYADVIVGAGPGGGPEVKLFDGATLTRDAKAESFAGFFAWLMSFQGGVYVAGGDLDGDGHAEVIVGAGAGGGPEVKIYRGKAFGKVTPRPQLSFNAFDASFRGGVRVGVQGTDSSVDFVLAGSGPGGQPQLNQYRVEDLKKGKTAPAVTDAAGPKDFAGGIFIAGSPR